MVELDLIDRKMLYELDRQSNLTFKELGKRLHISKETAAYRVKRLMGRGYIKNFLTTINISNLNRFYYKLFYKFHGTTPEIEQHIVSFIKNYNGIAYFASLEGRYDITFLLLSKDMRDLYGFLLIFRDKFGYYVLEQEILTMTNVHRFNFRFFYDKGELLHTRYPEELKEPDIDKLDYQIIKTLAQNSRMPLIELAKITDTDTNVIKYRIKKLKKMNILGTPVLDIKFDKFGMQQLQINFSLKTQSIVEKLVNYVAEFEQATFATTTLGKYDVAAEFIVKNTKELRRLLNKIKEKFSDQIVNYDVFIMEEQSINWFPYEMTRV